MYSDNSEMTGEAKSCVSCTCGVTTDLILLTYSGWCVSPLCLFMEKINFKSTNLNWVIVAVTGFPRRSYKVL